jgi:hypothetical protein
MQKGSSSSTATIGSAGVGGRELRLVRRAERRAVDAEHDQAELGYGVAGDGRQRVVEHQRAGAGVLEDEAALGRGQARVQRHHDEPRLGDAGRDLGVLQPVAEQHRHPLAGRQAAGDEAVAEPARALVERGERQGPVAVDDGRGTRRGLGELPGSRLRCSSALRRLRSPSCTSLEAVVGQTIYDIRNSEAVVSRLAASAARTSTTEPGG